MLAPEPLADLDRAAFARILGVAPDALGAEAARLVDALDFRHRVVTGREREALLLRALTALDADLAVAGPHRQGRWESGWQENLDAFRASGFDTDTLVPKFVRDGEPIRLGKDYVEPTSATFETNFVRVLRAHLFARHVAGCDELWEFGCGTGHNLVQAARMYPHLKLTGLDWTQATLDILAELRDRLGLNVAGRRFDLFAPDESVAFGPNAAALTIGTLEQTGTGHEPFIRFLVARRPRVVVHVETIHELYDQDDIFDVLAARYLDKRGYLRGLLPLLRRLEADGAIELVDARRTFGSFFHDGYSVVVWRPV